ncbi:histidine phosphatase family protein [Sphingomonas sp. GM_Shp_2]|uniref:SixA phosphatase family protein n=1 Tax=Sphingomonas sp. GM_Shp_2 TaxID=2937380 RepID=UPI00226AE919|nr:histidine phosphatase family protein [Sphingomonas sp. GM_Shp_2]
MKTLTLLRHAKSGWDDAVARDFDRPLNTKGRRAAGMIGRHLRQSALEFDRVYASPAVRVIETLDEVWDGYGRRREPVWDQRMYLASAATLLDGIVRLPDAAARVLLVGHNPGLEDLVLKLARASAFRDAVAEKYPTASVAELTFDVDHWSQVIPGGAVLTRFVRPRDLDPTLGPDTP